MNSSNFPQRKRQAASRPRFAARDLAIVYDDKDLLVADKPAGLLAVATAHEKERTVHAILTAYLRKGCGRSRKQLFIVHRLDRDTSGLLIFAKSEEAMLRLKERWKEFEKKYLAIVHGTLKKDSGIKTVRELKGKRIALGARGSSAAVEAPIFLAEYGITASNSKFLYLSSTDILDQLGNRTIDCGF